MNLNRRIAMGYVRTSGYALVLLGSLVGFASSALAQCVPVVYAFRHAEDTNPPNPPGPIFALTPTGQAHAALYPAMVQDFQVNSAACPVTKVYATTKVDKIDCTSNCTSATNAFDTATPLAKAVMGADPITTVTIGNGVVAQLYEYLGNGNNTPVNPNYSTDTANALRRELLITANQSRSSAIFWTSQGLHVLGGAIINANSNVPVKDGSAIPPRNAVYIFAADGPAPTISRFTDTPLASRTVMPSSFYLQCFNHVEPSDIPGLDAKNPKFIDPTGNPIRQNYYCGYNADQSNLGGKPPESCAFNAPCGTIPNDPSPTSPPVKSNKDILGKICATTALFVPNASGPSIFGACDSLN